MVQYERKDSQTVIFIKMPLKYLITIFFLRFSWSCENIQFSSRERLHFFCSMHCGRRYIILVHFTVFWVYLVWRSSCFVAVQMDLSTPPNEFSALTDITRGRGSGVYITSAHLTWLRGGFHSVFRISRVALMHIICDLHLFVYWSIQMHVTGRVRNTARQQLEAP